MGDSRLEGNQRICQLLRDWDYIEKNKPTTLTVVIVGQALDTSMPVLLVCDTVILGSSSIIIQHQFVSCLFSTELVGNHL